MRAICVKESMGNYSNLELDFIERVINYVPREPLTTDLISDVGLNSSRIDRSIKDLLKLVQHLRHAIAQFDIEVMSTCDADFIDFESSGNQPGISASFAAPEIYLFLQYYAQALRENLPRYLT